MSWKRLLNLNAVASKKLDIVDDAVVAMASQHTGLATSIIDKKLNEKETRRNAPSLIFLGKLSFY